MAMRSVAEGWWGARRSRVLGCRRIYLEGFVQGFYEFAMREAAEAGGVLEIQ